ncbi:MAG: hypothetical protein CVU51_16065 [Deltaproteobacteria bacterium HGW-Deltaproteobacteria-1]|nr:MAG: hypothetical protein CVU51_16065 [Deltaproteobacteria bacterium HGW-Deltaproteobacteria-1]
MIIQCRQCRTKFRFDDLNMEGDGLWMRCSHNRQPSRLRFCPSSQKKSSAKKHPPS